MRITPQQLKALGCRHTQRTHLPGRKADTVAGHGGACLRKKIQRIPVATKLHPDPFKYPIGLIFDPLEFRLIQNGVSWYLPN